ERLGLGRGAPDEAIPGPPGTISPRSPREGRSGRDDGRGGVQHPPEGKQVVLGRTTAVQQDHDRGVVVAGLDQGMQGKRHAESSGLVNAKYEPEHPVGCRGSVARLASRAGKYGTWRSQVAHLL